jgi:hypothetical protein
MIRPITREATVSSLRAGTNQRGRSHTKSHTKLVHRYGIGRPNHKVTARLAMRTIKAAVTGWARRMRPSLSRSLRRLKTRRRQTGTCAPACPVPVTLAISSRKYDSADVLFWVDIFAGAVAFTDGVLWLVVPRVHSRKLPNDESEVWSLPRLNGTALMMRLIRWTLRKRIRQVA